MTILITGKVPQNSEHIEIRYGSVMSGDWGSWLPVARISPNIENTFTVEYLINGDNEEEKALLDEVHKELLFYLIDKQEPDPWAYAQYHCKSTSNVYSKVHWSFFPEDFHNN